MKAMSANVGDSEPALMSQCRCGSMCAPDDQAELEDETREDEFEHTSKSLPCGEYMIENRMEEVCDQLQVTLNKYL